ncbi:MAG: hypothetical protein KC776_14355 [Myxococcales bacterium]|nr:hypothetical protein [Myxococcales bacterium]MCB9576129.1 hypothetical protein [Polyangiaceae bacterium]
MIRHLRENWRLWLAAALVITIASVVLVLHARSFLPFFVDDAFISLRYSARLLAGKGLTWSDGDKVEGYTNFLWVVLVAFGGLFQKNALINVARTVGILCSIGTLATVVLAERPKRYRALLPGLYAALALATAGTFAAWSIGGLEQSLLCFLVAAGVVLSYPLVERDEARFSRMWPAGLCFGLAALTRPDGILFAASVCGTWVLLGGFRPAAWLRALKLAVLPLGLVAAHVAFRQAYYHEWVPNTFHAKVAFAWSRVDLGWHYLKDRADPLLPLLLPLLLTLVAAVADRRRRRRALIAFVPLVVWTSYVIAIGGDIMPERRHVAVMIVLTALLSVEGLGWLTERGRFGAPVAFVVGNCVLGLSIQAQQDDPERARALADAWHWPGRPIGMFLHRAFADKDPLLAVDAAGALPYFAKLRTLDMLGLNDPWLPRHLPPGFGKGPLAHELGNGQYFLRRKPDIIVFHLPTGMDRALWRGGREMQADRSFGKLYQLVAFETPPDDVQTLHAWIRREDGPLGIQRGSDRIIIPGYLLSWDPRTRARMDADGWVGADLDALTPAVIRDVELAAGSYRIAVEGRGSITVAVLDERTRNIVGRAVGSADFSVPEHTRVVITTTMAWGSTARVRQLVLTPSNP